jgi:hypothetical protein
MDSFSIYDDVVVNTSVRPRLFSSILLLLLLCLLLLLFVCLFVFSSSLFLLTCAPRFISSLRVFLRVRQSALGSSGLYDIALVGVFFLFFFCFIIFFLLSSFSSIQSV